MTVKKRVVPALALFAIGFVMVIVSVGSHLGDYARSVFVHVDNPASYSFATFDKVLSQCVKDDRVDYKEVAKSKELQQAVDELAHIGPDRMVAPADRLCFWLNSYNLLTLKLIADRYPITSIRQLGQDTSFKRFIVGGKQLSLSDIYLNRILPMVGSVEPKAIFLMCGGSLGYPSLQDHAVQPEHLSGDAEAAAYKFLNDPANVYFDFEANTFYLSPFLEWNRVLFDKQYGSVFAFANRYLPAEKQANLQRVSTLTSFRPTFNWQLNDVAPIKESKAK